MVAANSLNISEIGFQSFDGVSVFKGRTLTAGTGVSITNGNGVAGNPVISLVGGGTAIDSITGNTGGIQGPDGTGNFNFLTANTTVQFAGTANTQTLDFGMTNLLEGTSGPSITSATQNTGYGQLALHGLNSGSFNAGFGGGALQSISTGTNNTALGISSAVSLNTGSHNVVIGATAGSTYNTSQSSNILISNIGNAADNNRIRIGTQGSGAGQQNTCFIAGITGVTAVGSPSAVSSTGQISDLGFGVATQILTSNGAGVSPTWQAPAAAGTVTSVSGTANRITSTGGNTPVIDISGSYVGQSSITTLGTITTGTWNATDIALADGGTNASLVASNGGIFYSSATAGAILSGTATAGQMLRSGASAAPTWSTATFPATATSTGTILRADGTNWVASTSTYPDTNAASTLLYASSANVMSALSTANSGVLTTDASGVPSIDTTNFVRQTTGMQVKGNNTNTAPPAGFLGEQIRSLVGSGSPVSLSTGVGANITSISLTAGIWDISCTTKFIAGATTSATLYQWGISPTSATTDVFGDDFGSQSYNTAVVGQSLFFTIPSYRVTLAGTTTYYLVAVSTFTISTMTAYGRISATRVG